MKLHYAAVLLTLLAFTSCKETSTEPEPPNSNGSFSYGTAKSFTVASATDITISDTSSGAAVRFPNGGGGTLTITPIKTAPVEGPAPGRGYRIEYTGTDSIEISVNRVADEVSFVHVWSTPLTSVYEDRTLDATWMALEPTDSTSNPTRFPLIDPGSQASSTKKGGSRQPAVTRPYDIWQSTIKKSSGQWEKLGILSELTKTCILSIYESLPASVQPAARAEIDGRLAPKVHYAYPGMISLYHPFIVGSGALGSTARTADPYFMFQTTGATAASSSTVAHEVGHYMSHVLLGDDSMATLEAQANKHHEMGDAHSGRPMLEEYAMFADYFMWGKTSGSINMEDPINVLNLLHSSTPAQIDWPSREGYATCLMAVLHAGKSQVTTGLSGAPENIPVIGASFTELWGMLANKPLNVNSLRTGVASYLNGRSKIDALPVLLERTGWSYHGTGKIVDGNAQPLAGAKVQNIAIVSSENRQYPTGNAQATTDNSGNFTLGRLCPGNSIIRVWVGNDSTDISIAIDADKPTNTAIDLGTLSIGRQSDMYLLDQFKLLSQTGIYEEPYHANVIIPILDRMITAKRLTLNLAYYRTPGSKSMILFADDSTDLFVGCDYTSTAADVVNVYDFRGTLTNGTLHSIWVAGSAGFENYATGWMESTLTLSGNTISGTLIFDGKRWVQDPNDPNKLVLKSQGIRTYSIHGTRQ